VVNESADRLAEHIAKTNDYKILHERTTEEYQTVSQDLRALDNAANDAIKNLPEEMSTFQVKVADRHTI
jgi:hypothetical protein